MTQTSYNHKPYRCVQIVHPRSQTPVYAIVHTERTDDAIVAFVPKRCKHAYLELERTRDMLNTTALNH